MHTAGTISCKSTSRTQGSSRRPRRHFPSSACRGIEIGEPVSLKPRTARGRRSRRNRSKLRRACEQSGSVSMAVDTDLLSGASVFASSYHTHSFLRAPLLVFRSAAFTARPEPELAWLVRVLMLAPEDSTYFPFAQLRSLHSLDNCHEISLRVSLRTFDRDCDPSSA